MNPTIKKIVALWPHALVLIGFIALSFAYFSPVIKGKTLPQMDNIHAEGAAHELVEYQKLTGEKAQWTDSMFGGMPAYQIKSDSSHNVFYHLTHAIQLGLPYTTVAILFLYLVGFYVLLLSLGARRNIAIVGAVAFALGSYNIIIIAAGHITKCYAIAMMPLVIGGVLMTFGGKRILGAVFTMVALGLELAFNHVQITYYLALALALLVIFELVVAIRAKQLKDFGLSMAFLAAATLFAVLPSTTNLWTTYEYGAYSIRGKSELKAVDGQKESSGLDKDYALSWSYGVGETPTLLVPNVVGGASQPIGSNLKSLQNADPQIAKIAAQQSAYWGGRGFTSGPVYVGAIICFLFFIGCFYYQGRLKWWLIAATIMSILLAWGKNFPILTDFMFYHFPLYNKFRTVEMALVIATVTIPLLAMLGLKAIYDNPEDVKYHPGKFFGALGLSAGVALIFAIAPTLFYDFLDPREAAQFVELKSQNALYASLEQAIIDARVELTRSDAMRSVVLIVLASSALWFCSVRRINANIMVATVGVLTLFDLWAVDRRYLSSDNFVSRSESQRFTLSEADKLIKADKTPHRVMALYTNPFNEVFTSYHHHSIGGYHGAKLRRYQDLIDSHLAPEWQSIVNALQNQDYQGIETAMANSPALNMLGCRYMIYNPQQRPLVNRHAFPEAWFVSNVRSVDTPDDALAALGSTDLRSVAILESQSDETFTPDSTATLRQTAYAPDRVVYESSSANDALAVFSEIYYPAGWVATIDGVESPILRADYLLRALRIPAGNHTIEFAFRPQSFHVGNAISLAASILVALITLAALFLAFKEAKAA